MLSWKNKSNSSIATYWLFQLVVLSFLVSFLFKFSDSAIAIEGNDRKVGTPRNQRFFGDIGDNYRNLKAVQELLKHERYTDALSLLKDFDRDSFIPDLILLYRASAERGLGWFEKSNSLIKRLVDGYPASPFLKKGMAIEARNYISILKKNGANASDEAESHLSNYTSSYPDDHEVSFFFARYLKKKGEIKRAKELFIRVFKGNSRYSEEALSELDYSDITARLLIEKATGYIKDMEFKKAEEILRKADSLQDGTAHQEEVLRKLAYSLFMQKRYDKAAEEYIKAGDLYNAARSFFRKGDLDSFNKMLSKLKDMRDRRAGSLILALAWKKMRDGSLDEALKLFEDVRKDYPLLEEDALWGTAWTYYRDGRYRDAQKLLTRLKNGFPSRRYDYWLKRCDTMINNDYLPVVHLDKGLKVHTEPKDLITVNDFYSVIEMGKGSGFGDWEMKKDGLNKNLSLPNPSHINLPKLQSELFRFYIFLSLGFQDEAMAELMKEIMDRKEPSIALAAAYYLQETGAYRKAMRLATLIKKEGDPYEIGLEDYRNIMYPLAFWPTVESVSRKFEVDPLLLLSIIREESRFEPDARSTAGALGLMQLMPVTARRLIKNTVLETGNAGNLKDIRTNIMIGAFYIKELMREFKSIPLVIAAYNAGEERVREWVNKGKYGAIDEFIEDIPYEETRNYVKKVLTTYANYHMWYTKQEGTLGKDQGLEDRN